MPDIYFDVDTALAGVPLNKMPVMDVDGLTVDTGVVFNEAGLSVEWNFTTSAGVTTHTAVTPTNTGGDYDFVNLGEGMYTIEIPASAGASINNDTEGYGWFSCNSTATLPWISPVFGFRAAALNDALMDGGDNLDVNTTLIEGTDATDQINAACDTSIETYHLHQLFHTDYDPASKPGVATALLNELVENNGGVSRYTAAALAQGPGGTPSQPLLQSTTILAYTSNTSFTLTTASADDNAYLNQMCVITDQVTSEQKAIGLISAYTGASKTVTLDADPLPGFTFANGDIVEIWAVTGSQVALEVDANGRVDVGNVAGTVQSAGDIVNLVTTTDTTVNAIEADLANGIDGLGALSADIATAQADLDTITGTDGVTLATAQALYAPATAAALATTDGKVDTISTNVDTVNTDLSNGTDGLGAIKGDTAAVKIATDKLTFTVANQVDSNIISVDDAAISEGGSAPASPYGQT